MGLKILLLSAGSLCGHGVLALMEPDRERYTVIGTSSAPEASGLFRCDAAHLVPPAAEAQAYAKAIAALVEEHRPDLVIPTRDEDVVAVADLRAVAADPAPYLAGAPELARILDDKLESRRFAEAHGLAFAPTAAALDDARALAQAHGWPLIVKPARGNGSRGVVVVLEDADLAWAMEAPGVVAQPYLDPPAGLAETAERLRRGIPLFFSFPEQGQCSIQTVIDREGRIGEVYAGRHTMVMGRPERSERIHDPALLALGAAYAEAVASAGWRGPFNVQTKRTPDGRYIAFELNGRFTGGSPARPLTGWDEWGAVLAAWGLERPQPPRAARGPAIAQGMISPCPVPVDAMRTLQETGRWRRSS